MSDQEGPRQPQGQGDRGGSANADGPGAANAPPPLVVASGLVLVEGVLTVIYGVGELAHTDSSRLVMGLTTATFLVAYGVAHLVCAWGMRNLRTWSRGPMLLAQLIWLGLAWNFREGATLPVAVGLAILALATLTGLLHPRSVDALDRAEFRRD